MTFKAGALGVACACTLLAAAAALACVPGLFRLEATTAARAGRARVNSVEVPVRKTGERLSVLLEMTGSAPRPGDLLDVRGQVLVRGAGRPGRIAINGAAVPIDRVAIARVMPGATLMVSKGRDVVEPSERFVATFDLPLQRQGLGTFVRVLRTGRAGKRVIRRGSISGKQAAQGVELEPLPYATRRYDVRTEAPVVALTFDDGPAGPETEQLLDILKRCGVHATFFVVGYRVEEHPGVVRRMVREGHEVANHTFGHDLGEASTEEGIVDEILRTEAAISRAAGAEARTRTGGGGEGGAGAGMALPVPAAPRWFRPNGGSMTAATLRAIGRTGHEVALWSLDTEDWLKPTAVDVLRAVAEARLSPGSSVLLHDGRPTTVHALARIIENLRQRGFRFVTLSELARLR